MSGESYVEVLVLLGRYDCLHDEGQALAQRCAQGGLRVTTATRCTNIL